MKNKQRFLTIREFAEQRGISRTTVYKWIKDGKLPKISKQMGKVISIPEKYLSLVIDHLLAGRPSGGSKPLPPLLSAREKFNAFKKIPFSLDELKQLFEEGKTFKEIAEMSGVSYQAIAQIYKRHFESSMSRGWDRRRAIIEERRKQRAEDHLEKVDKLAIVKEMAIENGYKVEPISHAQYSGRWFKDRILINTHLCRIYYAPDLSLIRSSKKGSEKVRSKLYYRFNLGISAARRSDFIIVVTGKGPHNIFIFPSHVISEQFTNKKRRYKFFYIPSEYREPYHNMVPKIDWWAYLDNWSALEK